MKSFGRFESEEIGVKDLKGSLYVNIGLEVCVGLVSYFRLEKIYQGEENEIQEQEEALLPKIHFLSSYIFLGGCSIKKLEVILAKADLTENKEIFSELKKRILGFLFIQKNILEISKRNFQIFYLNENDKEDNEHEQGNKFLLQIYAVLFRIKDPTISLLILKIFEIMMKYDKDGQNLISLAEVLNLEQLSCSAVPKQLTEKYLLVSCKILVTLAKSNNLQKKNYFKKINQKFCVEIVKYLAGLDGEENGLNMSLEQTSLDNPSNILKEKNKTEVNEILLEVLLLENLNLKEKSFYEAFRLVSDDMVPSNHFLIILILLKAPSETIYEKAIENLIEKDKVLFLEAAEGVSKILKQLAAVIEKIGSKEKFWKKIMVVLKKSISILIKELNLVPKEREQALEVLVIVIHTKFLIFKYLPSLQLGKVLLKLLFKFRGIFGENKLDDKFLHTHLLLILGKFFLFRKFEKKRF